MSQWSPNVACTDENLSVNGIYQELKLPSLGRCIFTVTPIHGPTAAIFNVTSTDTGGIKFVRSEVEVYDSKPKKTNITSEAVHDIDTQFGEDGLKNIAKLLKGLANEDENEKTVKFLKDKAVDFGSVEISEPMSPDFTWREISWKTQQCILEMNSKKIRTYNAFVVLPYKYASAIMSVFADLRNSDLADSTSLYVGTSGLTDWFINPDSTDENCYVGLRDIKGTGKGCAVFSPYTNEITSALDPETGSTTMFIWNRFAITISPIHTTDNPMLVKFSVKESKISAISNKDIEEVVG
jgi:hypothetical protein